ncbi:MAG: TlpA disulfide reductase family protein, partial [Actinomycetota bacterium]
DGASFDGTEIRIGEGTGSPTLLVFLAHWCPHCNDEIPELIELDADGRFPDGLDVVGISTVVMSDRDNYPPSEWTVEKGWEWPMLADDPNSTAIQAFGGQSFPYTVLLDGDGNVVARRAGTASADAIAAWLSDSLA